MLRLSAATTRKKPTAHRILGTLCRVLSCCAAGASLTAPAHAAPLLTEREGTLAVCSQGPAAALAHARRRQGAAEVTAAAVLPNPSLLVEHQRTLSGPSESETIAGVSLPLGLSGRRSLRQDAAGARREAAVAEADATLFEHALAFREAYVSASFAQARVAVLSEQQTALEATSATIDALTRSGEAASYDLLRQRVQARLHRSLLQSAQAHALASGFLLEAWTQGEVALPDIELSAWISDSTLPADAAPTPRRVQGLQAASRASALEARAARRRWVPDPEVFAGYRALAGGADIGHGMALGLTLPLTFFDHGQGEAAHAEAERDIMSASADQLGRERHAEVKAARARLERLASGLADVGQVRHDAAQLLNQAQRLYAAGELSIAAMLDAFHAAEQARLAELDRVLELALARLLVMRAMGTMLDAELDRACLPGRRQP